VLRACFRQLYIVAAEIPSSPARSLTVRLYGASSLAKMASRRSGEYFMGTFSLPQVGDSNSNICRGSNYSDSGGRGLAKNTAQLLTLFTLSNLWMARRHLMAEVRP